MKRIKQIKENSFAYELLELIKDLGAMADDYLTSPRQFSRNLDQAIRRGGGYRDSNYYKSLNSLEENNLIRKRKIGKYVTFKITEQGRKLLNHRPKLIKRSDGFSTVVIFDIPETKHGARDSLRRYLIRIGFTQLQKSVLIGPYKFSREIKDLARELNVDSCITVLSAKIDQV